MPYTYEQYRKRWEARFGDRLQAKVGHIALVRITEARFNELIDQMKEIDFVLLLEREEAIDSLTFWMADLLRLARELHEDLKRFYIPDKGTPPHLQKLEGKTDYDTVLARYT